VRPALSDTAISLVAFPAVYLGQIAVHADEEDICCHQANGPSGSRRAGSMPLATR